MADEGICISTFLLTKGSSLFCQSRILTLCCMISVCVEQNNFQYLQGLTAFAQVGASWFCFCQEHSGKKRLSPANYRPLSFFFPTNFKSLDIFTSGVLECFLSFKEFSLAKIAESNMRSHGDIHKTFLQISKAGDV